MSEHRPDTRSSVTWDEAEQFIEEADIEFRMFIRQYEHFGPTSVIPRWWLSRMPVISELFRKREDACQQRAEDLIAYFVRVFGTAKWREFKYHVEYISHRTHIPFPHGFTYLELHWHDSLGTENVYYRIYDAYYGIIVEDWEP
jgi:hypothetical protein